MSDPIEKLDKLLRHAENCSTEAEAEAFLTRAKDLAARWHLELKVSSAGESSSEHLARESDVVVGTWRIRAYRWTLAWIVARAHGCTPWLKDVYTAGVDTDAFDLDKVVKNAWCGEQRDASARMFEVDDQHVIELSAMYSNALTAADVKYAIEVGAKWRFELGTDERPRVDIVDESIVDATCDLCGDPIFGFELRHSIGPSHWACYRRMSARAPKLALRFGPTRSRVLVMVGMSNIADAAIYVYRCLVNDVDRLARKIAPRGSGKTSLNSARLGIVHGLRRRMAAEEQAAIIAAREAGAEVQTAALVLVEAVEESTRWLSDAYGEHPYSTAKTSTVEIDGDHYSAGVAAARDIEVPDPQSSRDRLSRGTRMLPEAT